MKRSIFGFVTIVLLLVVSPRSLFAQTITPEPTKSLQPLSKQTQITPTVPPTTPSPMPTANPTVSPTPQPTIVTPIPTRVPTTPPEIPSPQPASQNTTINIPPSPPPPPPAPLQPVEITSSHLLLPIATPKTSSVATTIGKYLTVPFAVSLHYLPKNFYTEAGLSKQANAVLLFLAMMNIGAGTALLVKPTVMRWAQRQNFSLNHKEEKRRDFTIPRIAFHNSL